MNWISVEDELPKEDGRYLFYHTILGVQSSYYYNDLMLDKAVTHWMHLPTPPSGSSEIPNICKKGGEELKHKFFRDAERLCWWCNTNRVDVISVTFVPQGGWCIFFKVRAEMKRPTGDKSSPFEKGGKE